MTGKATVEGIPGQIVAGCTNLSGNLTHTIAIEELQDEHGFDMTWISRNNYVEGDFNIRLTGSSKANAKLAGAFLVTLAAVTLSGFDLAWMNSAYWQYRGGTIDLANDKGGGFNVKLRLYDPANPGSDYQKAATTAST
jgi:hypothetical protein